MILVDTSIWVDHLRRRDESLTELLAAGLVLAHPFIRGELACGRMKNRLSILAYLMSCQVQGWQATPKPFSSWRSENCGDAELGGSMLI